MRAVGSAALLWRLMDIGLSIMVAKAETSACGTSLTAAAAPARARSVIQRFFALRPPEPSECLARALRALARVPALFVVRVDERRLSRLHPVEQATAPSVDVGAVLGSRVGGRWVGLRSGGSNE